MEYMHTQIAGLNSVLLCAGLQTARFSVLAQRCSSFIDSFPGNTDDLQKLNESNFHVTQQEHSLLNRIKCRMQQIML